MTELYQLIALLRLEGKCSISGISNILNFLDYTPSSTGTISEWLKQQGSKLQSTLQAPIAYFVIYLSDEIFSNHRPILVTLEPKSTAILKIELAPDRSAATWENHFKEVEANGYLSLGLASDRGTGLTKGYEEACPDKPWYSDHFHEFRALNQLLVKIEKAAYSDIEQEEECQRKFNNACSESNLQRRLTHYEQAAEACRQSVELYEEFSALMRLTSSALSFFGTNGEPRTPKMVERDLKILLEMMGELQHSLIIDAAKVINEHMEDIVRCFEQVKATHSLLTKIVPKEALDFVCLAWQHEHKTHQTKGKLKYYHQKERDFWLECSEGLLGNEDQAQAIITEAFDQLNGMVRASSLVEMVNSQIRPYLNECKGNITQETLNLIMFYHNHRRYESGKRKEKAPIEILLGKQLEKHWVELLVEQAGLPQAA